MRSAKVDTSSVESSFMTTSDRGGQIKRRRLNLGITSLRQFEEAMGGKPGRGTLGDVEAGVASERTYDLVEAWLSSQEEENGLPLAEITASDPAPIRVTFHDVSTSSIGEIIVEGPSDHPDDLIATIAKLLAEVRKSGTD